MDEKKIKIKKQVTLAQAAEFFRKLADQLEDLNSQEPLPGAVLEETAKLKVELKQKKGAWVLKADAKPIKIKSGGKEPKSDQTNDDFEKAREPGSDEQPEQTPDTAKTEKPLSYKKLKKRMDKNFQAISQDLKSGNMPDRAQMASFLTDSDEMVSRPGKGDVMYKGFTGACRRLRNAYEARDVPGALEAARVLDRIKKNCHDSYK